MELWAVFETWHLGDGNYPALEKGMLVNLSFEVEPKELERAPAWTPWRLVSLGGGEYEFAGQVARVYDDGGVPLAVIDTGEFRFYVSSGMAAGLRAGECARGRGTLALDHYAWVEFLHRYDDPPDLFYTLRVERIVRARTPERFIKRGKRTLSYPARVAMEECAPEDVSEVDAIHDDGICHYVVLFSDRELPALPVPRTFLP
jgi:hypothetical protein